jgi:hypothetical protein
MWILPPSMSSRYSAEPGDSISALDWRYQALARSVTSKGKLIPAQYWQRAWKTAGWIRRLSGRMLLPSMAARGAELWIASLADGRVRTLASQAKAAESPKESAPVYGENSLASFAKWDRALSCWKTSQLSLIEDSTSSSETWPISGTLRNGTCLARTRSERLTSATDCSFWPTPTAQNYGSNQGGAAGRTGPIRYSLDSLARKWQTPTTMDAKSRGYSFTHGNHQMPFLTLAGQAMAFGRQDLKMPTAGNTGKVLNPAFVEALMGWPKNWSRVLSACESAETASSLSKPLMRSVV